MKVLYYIGMEVTADTIVKMGILDDDTQRMYLEDKNDKTKYFLDDIRQVDRVRVNGLGRMIKVVNGGETLFLVVPWIFLKIGGGFAIGNTVATKKAGTLLSCAMQRQQKQAAEGRG